MKTLFQIGPKEGELCSWKRPFRTTMTFFNGNLRWWFDFELYPLFGMKVYVSAPRDIWREQVGGLWWLTIDLFPLSPIIQISLRLPVFYTKPITRIEMSKAGGRNVSRETIEGRG